MCSFVFNALDLFPQGQGVEAMGLSLSSSEEPKAGTYKSCEGIGAPGFPYSGWRDRHVPGAQLQWVRFHSLCDRQQVKKGDNSRKGS